MIKGLFRCVTKIKSTRRLHFCRMSTMPEPAPLKPEPQPSSPSGSSTNLERSRPMYPSHALSPNDLLKYFRLFQSSLQRVSSLPCFILDTVCQFFRSYDPDSPEVKERIVKQLQEMLHKNNLSEELLHDMYQAMESVVEFLDKAQVGFLKGDIHSDSIFKIQIWLRDRIKLFSEISPSEIELGAHFKKLFNMITTPSNFRLPMYGIKKWMKDSARNIYQRQLVVEQQSQQIATRVANEMYDSLLKIGKAQQLDISKKYFVEWFPTLTEAIKQEQTYCRDQNLRQPRKSYAQHLLKLTPEKIATLTLGELLKHILGCISRMEKNKNRDRSQDFGLIQVNQLIKSIGSIISSQITYDKEQSEFKKAQKALQKKRDELIKAKSKALNVPIEHVQAQQQYVEMEQPEPTPVPMQHMRYMKPALRKSHLEKLRARIVKNRNSSTNFQHGVDIISREVQSQIGGLIVVMLKDLIKTKNIYGFNTPLLTEGRKKRSGGGRQGSIKSYRQPNILKINEDFINELIPKIQKQNSLFLHMDRSLPTVTEPAPWIDHEIGGYYLRPTAIMRYSGSKQQQRAVRYADISRVSHILDLLGAVPWKINRKVLDIVQYIWDEGGGKGTIPKRYSNMRSYVHKFQIKQERDQKKSRENQKKVQLQRDQHSLRCDFRLKLNVAQSFDGVERFYFPHNMDFRGRVYPIPPHLNHMGADLSRGILNFAEGKKLGQTGLKWLKIHTANLIGFDKARLPDKIEAIEKNLPMLKAIAENPKKNQQWLQYEDCWQAIASIMELCDALKSPNPQQYVSHLHIHQDGSCNGLQHYAALGLDSQGAAQVNLDALDKPGDLYSHVARMVADIVQRDSKDDKSENKDLAAKLKGHIKRKTVKQTVMTSVYGVTFIGAKEQILKQIRDQKFLEHQRDQYAAAVYLAKCTMNCIKHLFNSAHEIKKWLKDCAFLIGRASNPVSWITPLGLPVVQPYRNPGFNDVIQTLTQSIVMTRQPDELPVQKQRQVSAFPPNFVHSLDSTHMMYTADKCYNEGITFAAVHDSYWTHAATVERMNVILREEFIRLHEEPLLDRLKESFSRRFPTIEFPPIPPRGQFDLHKVKKSLYFFS